MLQFNGIPICAQKISEALTLRSTGENFIAKTNNESDQKREKKVESDPLNVDDIFQHHLAYLSTFSG